MKTATKTCTRRFPEELVADLQKGIEGLDMRLPMKRRIADGTLRTTRQRRGTADVAAPALA